MFADILSSVRVPEGVEEGTRNTPNSGDDVHSVERPEKSDGRDFDRSPLERPERAERERPDTPERDNSVDPGRDARDSNPGAEQSAQVRQDGDHRADVSQDRGETRATPTEGASPDSAPDDSTDVTQDALEQVVETVQDGLTTAVVDLTSQQTGEAFQAEVSTGSAAVQAVQQTAEQLVQTPDTAQAQAVVKAVLEGSENPAQTATTSTSEHADKAPVLTDLPKGNGENASGKQNPVLVANEQATAGPAGDVVDAAFQKAAEHGLKMEMLKSEDVELPKTQAPQLTTTTDTTTPVGLEMAEANAAPQAGATLQAVQQAVATKEPGSASVTTGNAPASDSSTPVEFTRKAEAKSQFPKQPQMVDKLVRQAELTRARGESRMRMTLTPPELGQMKIELNMKNKNLTGNIVVESAAAQELVSRHLSDLREALEARGIELGELEVTVKDENARDNGNAMSDQQHKNEQDAGSNVYGSVRFEDDEEAAPEPQPIHTGWNQGRLNLVA
jgi:flagellar hook-length control protein FliK